MYSCVSRGAPGHGSGAGGGALAAPTDGPFPTIRASWLIAGRARTGATQLIREDGVKFIMMLGGDTWPAVQPIANKTGMLVSTLLPSDLSPDTKTLIASILFLPQGLESVVARVRAAWAARGGAG